MEFDVKHKIGDKIYYLDKCEKEPNRYPSMPNNMFEIEIGYGEVETIEVKKGHSYTEVYYVLDNGECVSQIDTRKNIDATATKGIT